MSVDQKLDRIISLLEQIADQAIEPAITITGEFSRGFDYSSIKAMRDPYVGPSAIRDGEFVLSGRRHCDPPEQECDDN